MTALMTSEPVRFGLKLGGQDTTAGELRDVWRVADDAGFDHLWCLDLYAAIGAAGPDRPIFEGWALQAAMAVTTTRIRIGCAFTGNTHRPPWVLAKLAVTVDHLSGGRLIFGIGAGYEEVEHRMYSIGGLDHRVGRLAESLECLKLLWTQERVDFNGKYYTLREAIANPKPLQNPHPPICIAADREQMLRVAARHADIWCHGGDPVRDPLALERFQAAREKLDTFCAEVGRDPRKIRSLFQIRWDGRDPQYLLEHCATWLRVGCTEQVIYLDPMQIRPNDGAHAAEAAALLLTELRCLSFT
jgi:alkanesulfonate monooxygenase SsuD/methylene tetrahydromethanopterin reductase-like flavin-dependent oxidoreductase (luciferase family)